MVPTCHNTIRFSTSLSAEEVTKGVLEMEAAITKGKVYKLQRAGVVYELTAQDAWYTFDGFSSKSEASMVMQTVSHSKAKDVTVGRSGTSWSAVCRLPILVGNPLVDIGGVHVSDDTVVIVSVGRGSFVTEELPAIAVDWRRAIDGIDYDPGHHIQRREADTWFSDLDAEGTIDVDSQMQVPTQMHDDGPDGGITENDG